MRVVHLTSVHRAHDVRILEKECKSLAHAGHLVTLIAPHEQAENVDGVEIKCVSPPPNRFSRMTRTVWKVYREARRQDADIYHAHDPELIPIGLLLRLCGKRVIYDAHEDLPLTIQNKTYLPAWMRPAIRHACGLVEAAALGKFTAVVAATPEIGKRMQRFHRVTIVVNNFPVSARVQGPPWAARTQQIVYAGSITAARGIRELVQAMELLPDSLSIKLTLAGTVAPVGLLDDLKRLPGWKRVNWLGHLDQCATSALLRDSRIGMVVLHPTANYLSSWPVKLFEYMQAGLPVIASDFPAWREIVSRNGCGLLVDPLQPKAIASAIEEIVSAPDLAQEMGLRGREAVAARYNWTSEQTKLCALYEHLRSGEQSSSSQRESLTA